MRPPSTTSSNDDYFTRLIDDKIKNLEGSFHLKMSLMEKENKESKESLKNQLYIIHQEKQRQNEENMRLREELVKMKAALLEKPTDDLADYDNNDLNYDSECSEEETNTHQNTMHHSVSDENLADPYYNSSDNEDLANEVYYDSMDIMSIHNNNKA
jgi:hypothetical protein